MLDFDYMAPEIIVNAVRLISGGEPIKVRGVVYVPERTCRLVRSDLTHVDEALLSCSECGAYARLGDNYCPNCGKKVVIE